MAMRADFERRKRRRVDDGFLQSLVDIIKEKYSDYQFTVYQLAEAVGLCESYLEERLRVECGITPQKLMEAFRISEALKMMLANGGKDFYEISKAVGYKNPKAMRLAFKRRLGMTPDYCRDLIESGYDLEELLGKIWDGIEEVRLNYDGGGTLSH